MRDAQIAPGRRKEKKAEVRIITVYAMSLAMVLSLFGEESRQARALCRSSHGEASVVDVGGVPRIAINGEIVAVNAVMPNPREDIGSAAGVLEDFAAAGVRFSSVMGEWWLGEGEYDWEAFDQMAKVVTHSLGGGFFFPRIGLNPPDKWIKAHPEETFAGKVNPRSLKWRKLYRGMLRDLIAHVESSSYADKLIGYHLGALHCGEWIVYPVDRKLIPSVNGDPKAVFPTLEATAERRKFIRNLSDAVADAVVDAATFVKQATDGKKLVGAFMGYFAASHESMMLVFQSGKVDFIAAPPRYFSARETGFGGRSQMYYQASCRLHGCVFFEETDFRTFLSIQKFAPEGVTRRRPLDESVDILRRSVGKMLAGGWQNWWFLLSGNHCYDHPRLMSVIRRSAELQCETLMRDKWEPAEVAVFTSAGEYLSSTMTERIEPCDTLKTDFHEFTLPACGTPFDSYELTDLLHPKLPEYKVYIFPNALTLTEPLRAKMRELAMKPDRTVLWFRAPGYYRDATEGFENVHALTNETRGVFFADAPKPGVLREVIRKAGVHVWIDTSDVIAQGRGFLTVHASTDGEKVLRLPRRSDVQEVFGSSPKKSGVTEIREFLKRGQTRVWRMTPCNCAATSF